MRNLTLSKGFSLIELMIVVAIISILASIALPAYTDHIRRGRITEAFNELSTMRSRLEMYFLDNRTYVGACQAGTVAPLPAGEFFNYACDNLGINTYTVIATMINGGGFTFSIDQDNVRTTVAAPAGWNTGACWIRRKGDVC